MSHTKPFLFFLLLSLTSLVASHDSGEKNFNTLVYSKLLVNKSPSQLLQPARPVINPPTPVVKPPSNPYKAPPQPVKPPSPSVEPPTSPVNPPTSPVKPPTPPYKAPYPPVKPPSPPVKPPPTPVMPRIRTRKDCTPLCGVRCSLHSRKNMCERTCITCCLRCKCVPPGTYGNREKCGKCYTDMTTRGKRPKCP